MLVQFCPDWVDESADVTDSPVVAARPAIRCHQESASQLLRWIWSLPPTPTTPPPQICRPHKRWKRKAVDGNVLVAPFNQTKNSLFSYLTVKKQSFFFLPSIHHSTSHFKLLCYTAEEPNLVVTSSLAGFTANKPSHISNITNIRWTAILKTNFCPSSFPVTSITFWSKSWVTWYAIICLLYCLTEM